MFMTAVVRENALVESLVRALPRSLDQTNGLGESDAELLRLPGTDRLLAITTDAIVEEIEAGLYRDPYLIGWMTVMSSASDLAAVGADPLGILLSQTLPETAAPAFLNRMQQGVRDACAACGLPVLGGDTNHSARLHVGSSAVGTVPAAEAMLRSGCRPGDRLFASGPLGIGSAYAFEALTRRDREPDVPFLPMARVREGQLARRFASSCMDSSDGALATLDEIMRRSRVGMKLDISVDEILHPAARRIAEAAGLPPWTLLAGPHGEFELIFSVPQRRCGGFRAAAARSGWHPMPLGQARSLPGLELGPRDSCMSLDTGAVRNLAGEAQQDIGGFVEGLMSLAGAGYSGA
jgi:thiamine-monophosphate kinase